MSREFTPRGGDRDRDRDRDRGPWTVKARLRAKARKKARKQSKKLFGRRKISRFSTDSTRLDVSASVSARCCCWKA